MEKLNSYDFSSYEKLLVVYCKLDDAKRKQIIRKHQLFIMNGLVTCKFLNNSTSERMILINHDPETKAGQMMRAYIEKNMNSISMVVVDAFKHWQWKKEREMKNTKIII